MWASLRTHALALGLASLGVAACLSVAATNLAKAWLVVFAVAMFPQVRRLAPWRHPVFAGGLVLLGYIAAVSVVHGGPGPGVLKTLKHYQELLIAPLIFALLCLAREPRLLLRALFVGAVCLACVHWYALLVLHAPETLDARRISAGFMLAVCAFIALVLSTAHARPWPLRLLALFLALTTLFAVGGRTGHIVLLTLALYATWSHAPLRWRWPALLVVAAVVTGLGVSSDEVQQRFQETVAVLNDGADTEVVQKTSTAIRVHMLRVSRDIVGDHALVGVGYAGYAEAYRLALAERMARDPAFYAHVPQIWTHSDNPHSEYLMQLLGGGIVGLVLFLLWLLVIVRQAVALAAPYRRVLMGLCIAFAVGCLFNSLLLDFMEGHFFVIVLAAALCAGRPLPARPAHAG